MSRALSSLGGKGNGCGAESVGPSHRQQGSGQHGKGFGAKTITYWTASEAAEEGEGDKDAGSAHWPRALTRSTQNPFSSLWNVTRSTRPARASVAAFVPAGSTTVAI